jgi:hypothetical protein
MPGKIRRKTKPKPPAREATVQVGLRLPLSIAERVDRHVERLRKETRLVGVTRTDAAIALLVMGLQTVERTAKKTRVSANA